MKHTTNSDVCNFHTIPNTIRYCTVDHKAQSVIIKEHWQ